MLFYKFTCKFGLTCLLLKTFQINKKLLSFFSVGIIPKRNAFWSFTLLGNYFEANILVTIQIRIRIYLFSGYAPKIHYFVRHHDFFLEILSSRFESRCWERKTIRVSNQSLTQVLTVPDVAQMRWFGSSIQTLQ